MTKEIEAIREELDVIREHGYPDAKVVGAVGAISGMLARIERLHAPPEDTYSTPLRAGRIPAQDVAESMLERCEVHWAYLGDDREEVPVEVGGV